MSGAAVATNIAGSTPAQRLYEKIGTFLAQQRLEPNPVNYAFAFHVVADPDGPLARAVLALTDGGIRLTMRDVSELGAEIDGGLVSGKAPNEAAEGLMAQTQMQVESFEDMMRAIRAETHDFGRDLAASADAIRVKSCDTHATPSLIAEVAQITASMTQRIEIAEARLEQATHEASDLRSKLEEARDNARRDPLTDLPNRRAFEEAYAALAGAGSGAGGATFLAVCDVDHFKLVNDQFGHAVGDRVLKAIAAALSTSCAGHLVARYGGEEFAVLITGIERQGALAIIENARIAVAAKRYRLRETDTPLGEVTFSAGLAEATGDEPYMSLFQRADAQLYAAKADGRNCTHTDW